MRAMGYYNAAQSALCYATTGNNSTAFTDGPRLEFPARPDARKSKTAPADEL
jgi:hypothetical protein